MFSSRKYEFPHVLPSKCRIFRLTALTACSSSNFRVKTDQSVCRSATSKSKEKPPEDKPQMVFMEQPQGRSQPRFRPGNRIHGRGADTLACPGSCSPRISQVCLLPLVAHLSGGHRVVDLHDPFLVLIHPAQVRMMGHVCILL